jgi:hypothetical protein
MDGYVTALNFPHVNPFTTTVESQEKYSEGVIKIQMTFLYDSDRALHSPLTVLFSPFERGTNRNEVLLHAE